MNEKKRKPGRPPKLEGESLDATIHVRLKQAEREALKAAAERRKVSLSEWARLALVTSANQQQAMNRKADLGTES